MGSWTPTDGKLIKCSQTDYSRIKMVYYLPALKTFLDYLQHITQYQYCKIVVIHFVGDDKKSSLSTVQITETQFPK